MYIAGFHLHIQININRRIIKLAIYVQLVIKKRNTPIYFNTNNRTEMKLVPIIMDYCLLQFDALEFLLGVRLHGGLFPTFIFSL